MTEAVPRTMSVYCDETGAHDCSYFAWGSIWMAHERQDEFNARIDAIAKKHGVRGEFGWKDSQGRAAFCKELVRWFFQQRWVCFQSLFVRKQDMRIFTTERLKNDTVAYKKLLCTLVAVNAANFDALPGGPRQFRILVDQVGDKPSVTEEEYRIVAAAIRKRTDHALPPVATFARVDSQSARGIQLADLLVGAIRAEWEADGKKPIKRGGLRKYIAECLGWENLRATTPRNLKFNIWLHNACEGYAMHPMRLKYPQGDPEEAFSGKVVMRGRSGFRPGFPSEFRSDRGELDAKRRLARSREAAKGAVLEVYNKGKPGEEKHGTGEEVVRSAGADVEVVGGSHLTLRITRVAGSAKGKSSVAQSREVAKEKARKTKEKKAKVVGVAIKETKAAERAEARAERLKTKKARTQAWAKRKAKSRARKKAKKEQWEARMKEKEASRKVAKPKEKTKKKGEGVK